MKRAFLVVAFCLGLAAFPPGAPPQAQDASGRPVQAQLQPPLQPQVVQANLQATRQYYTTLIAGPAPNLAGLTLMMTMMPKGGDLHHHYSGSIYAETFLDWVKERKACVWQADNPAREKAFKFTIWSEPDKLTPEERADCLDADVILSADNNGFYRELLSIWSDKDFYNHSHQQTPPDQHFFDTFFYIGGISSAHPDVGLRQLKARAIAENVQYIETMLGQPPRGQNEALAGPIEALAPNASDADIQAALTPFYDFLAADEGTAKAVKDYVAALDRMSEGLDDGDFKVRFQTFVVRNDPRARVFSGLYSSFVAASAGGKVVGVNIVGPENRPVSMRDYSLHMRMFAFLKQKFPAVKLSLHAGELALGMVPPEGLQNHIREAVEIAGAQRIGHGVDVAHERDATSLLRLMREKKVAVEINLTSNEFILGVKGEAHPILLYRHAGVPFVISTDDSGVSRNNLSAEYVLFASRYRPTYDMLKETAFNGIRLSFLSDAEKTAELGRLAQRFTAFEAKVADLAKGLPGAKGP